MAEYNVSMTIGTYDDAFTANTITIVEAKDQQDAEMKAINWLYSNISIDVREVKQIGEE